MLERSALTIKGLTYMPTGATVAALTTSLPETPGGERNWDYRYTWIRDTTFTLQALHYLQLDWEADEFMQFVADIEPTEDGSLQIMYGIDGRRDLTESTRDDLSGYANASPVRIGNGAFDQRQNDVFGAVLDSVLLHTRQSERLPRRLWPIVQSQAACAEKVWEQPDQGIWEARGAPQHYVSSKLMCWVAMDRAAKLAAIRGDKELETSWRKTADEIQADILEHGVNDAGVLTQHYGSDSLDASVLLAAVLGFLPADDERLRATVLAIADDLTEDGFVLRYRTDQTDDGLSGKEGTFLICSFWLVSALAIIGEVQRARDLLERLIRIASPLGLYAEEFDTETAHHLGNFPQAFSHLAFIEAAGRLILIERLARDMTRVASRSLAPSPPSGEQFEIGSGNQRVVVAEVGATLRSYRVDGHDVIDGFSIDETSSAGRGQVLAPWPNRLEDGTYEFDGHRGVAALDEPEHANAIHGLVRWLVWHPIARSTDAVTLGCVVPEQPAYPWRIDLEVEYRVSRDGLEVTTVATNRADLHGAVRHRVPSVPHRRELPSIDEARLTIPARRRLETDRRGLPVGDASVIGTDFDFTDPKIIGDARLDTAFTELGVDEGTTTVRLESEARRVELWMAEGFRYVMVYTGDTLEPVERRRRGIAIEPMTCPPNALRTGTDLIRLEPRIIVDVTLGDPRMTKKHKHKKQEAQEGRCEDDRSRHRGSRVRRHRLREGARETPRRARHPARQAQLPPVPARSCTRSRPINSRPPTWRWICVRSSGSTRGSASRWAKWPRSIRRRDRSRWPMAGHSPGTTSSSPQGARPTSSIPPAPSTCSPCTHSMTPNA